ncbi:MAG: hypothetical protein JXR80_02235 [Deltaproteobacteria bacterium]|nr:hypothetical protein [Deltaproteobacteria bacterium]
MSRPQVRGYKNSYSSLNITDIGKIIEEIPTLTKLGGVCLVTGKFVGILAIPAVFIPALNSLAIFLVITWGGLVFTSIALCSYEHFREKKICTDQEKIALVKQLLSENQDLREHLASTLQNDAPANKYQLEDHYESRKVINLNSRIHSGKY